MQNAFKEIKDKLEKLKEYEANGDCPKDGMCSENPCKCTSCYSRTAIEIVDQVADEYGKDINVRSNIVCKLKEFLKEKKKYNSEQADIWRDGADKDAYLREMKDLYMDRANTFGRVLNEIKALEEEYNNGWIPCSERLPDIYTSVLITYRRQHDGYSKVVVARMQADCEWKIEFGGYCGSENVVAWQPLPEPYKEVER